MKRFLYIVLFLVIQKNYSNNNDYLFVDIKILDKSYSFLFDTGTSHSMINQNVIEEIKTKKLKVSYNPNNFIPSLIFHKQGFWIFKKMIGYKTPVKFSLDPNKEIEHIFYINKKCPDILKELKADGIIGWDFIKKFSWEIDLKNKKLYISNKLENKNSDLTLNIIVKKNLPYISKLKVNNRDIYSLLLDTGNDGFLSIGKNIFSKIEKLNSTNTLYGKDKGTYVEVKEIQINGLKLKAKSIPIGIDSEIKRSRKTIGMSFLSVFSKIYIDNINNKIELFE